MLRLPSEAPSLCVGKPETPSTKLLAESAVLLLEILDHLLLVAAKTAGQKNSEEFQRQRRHRKTLARPVRAEID